MLRSRLMLRYRRYSAQAFDPQKWITDFALEPSQLPRSLEEALRDYRKLPHHHQRSVQNVIPPGTLQKTLELHNKIVRRELPSDVFSYISQNVDCKISSGLVETFLFSLLASNNLNATVALVHVVLQSDAQYYKLSNQFWSLLASKAVSSCHHAAASLVYHEIIDPYVNYVNKQTLQQENEHIPFLLLPTTLEGVALVFARNGNYVCIEGLLSYFKRFYSYFGHRNVYEALHIAKVEALSISNQFEASIRAFVELAVRYRGHMKYKDPKLAAHSLKYASSVNFAKRQRNIMHNNNGSSYLDEFDQATKPFSPDINFNTYTIPNGPYWAILDGFLAISDLPRFCELLERNISKMIEKKASAVDRLLAFINSNHHALGRFVIASLCKSGYCMEAIAVANRLPAMYPHIYASAQFSITDEFCCLFRAIKYKFKNENFSNKQDLHDALLECFSLCQHLSYQNRISYALLRSFVSSYLSSPMARLDELNQIIASSETRPKKTNTRTIALNEEDYHMAICLGLSPLYLKETFCIRL